VDGDDGLTLGALAILPAGLLVSAGLTELPALHFIFGAFLFGVILQREGTQAVREDLIVRIGQVSRV
jgi:Kef-type K+ transport system membrane component KefB